MLRIRKKREAWRNALTVERLAQVEASVIGLANEDLLDHAIRRSRDGTARHKHLDARTNMASAITHHICAIAAR